MGGRLSLEAGRVLVTVLLIACVLVVLGGAGAAGVCKFTNVNCHLRDSPTVLSRTSGSITLPEGFSAEVVASGLDVPTDFDFLPDGRVLVAEKSGLVKLVADGQVDPEPVLDLSDRINVALYRGLLAIAVDPNFDENHYVYVVYTPRNGSDGSSKQPTHEVVSRFTVTDDRAGDEHVIVGAEGREAGTCSVLPKTADCLPSEVDHNGADIVFAPDGMLFIATGDGGGLEDVEHSAFNAQNVDSLGGKILHVNREGEGLPSAPFFDGDPSSNRSKVWALGFRNPFRMTQLTSGRGLIVGDVGWRAIDEIDTVRRGENFGWPCFEGREQTSRYRATSTCTALYERSKRVVPPTIEVRNLGSTSVTGGEFVTTADYPREYRMYYYGDWVASTISRAQIDPRSGELRGEPAQFAQNAGGPVSLRVGPDGLLYALALNYGELQRFVYDQ